MVSWCHGLFDGAMIEVALKIILGKGFNKKGLFSIESGWERVVVLEDTSCWWLF